MNQQINPEDIYESGKSLVSISNLIISQVVVVFLYSFFIVTTSSSLEVDDILLLNIVTSLILLVLSIVIVVRIRESGKNLMKSVSQSSTQIKPHQNESTSVGVTNNDKGKTTLNSDGSYETFYQNGNLMERSVLIKSSSFSHLYSVEKFYQNGSLESNGNLLNGKKEGMWDYYNDNGDLVKSIIYVNGIPK